MKGLYTTDVFWLVPTYGHEKEMEFNYQAYNAIYKKFKARYKYKLSKPDMLVRFGIPYFMRPIKFKVTYYAMLAFTPLDTLWTPAIRNPKTKFKMLSKEYSALFSVQLVMRN